MRPVTVFVCVVIVVASWRLVRDSIHILLEGTPVHLELDAVRGANPRPQAALIWAPGVALAIAGASVVVGAYGLTAGGAGLGALGVPFATAALV